MTREEAIYCMKSYLPDDNYKHCIKCKYYREDGCESSKAHAMAIKALEEQKTGRWIETREQNDAEPAIIRQCSRCGGFLERGRVGTNYCPNCGAQMGVEE